MWLWGDVYSIPKTPVSNNNLKHVLTTVEFRWPVLDSTSVKHECFSHGTKMLVSTVLERALENCRLVPFVITVTKPQTKTWLGLTVWGDSLSWLGSHRVRSSRQLLGVHQSTVWRSNSDPCAFKTGRWLLTGPPPQSVVSAFTNSDHQLRVFCQFSCH